METSLQLYQHNFFTMDFIKSLITKELFVQLSGVGASLNQKDLENIKTNVDYLASLTGKKSITENQNKNYQEVKRKAEEIIKLIDSELD